VFSTAEKLKKVEKSKKCKKIHQKSLFPVFSDGWRSPKTRKNRHGTGVRMFLEKRRTLLGGKDRGFAEFGWLFRVSVAGAEFMGFPFLLFFVFFLRSRSVGSGFDGTMHAARSCIAYAGGARDRSFVPGARRTLRERVGYRFISAVESAQSLFLSGGREKDRKGGGSKRKRLEKPVRRMYCIKQNATPRTVRTEEDNSP